MAYNFNMIGPKYLTHIDWNDFLHRKSIAASLVKGVYTLENDRQQNQHGSQALSPAWWEFFNFKLVQKLVDDEGESIFGAIFESSPHNQVGQCPPKYVIAFRGTINKLENMLRDHKQNFQIFINKLEKSPRVQAGMKAVINIIVQANGPQNIWLAGHSAGSSLALLIGRHMVIKNGHHHLETYLFNPPFPSLPIEQIKSDKLKNSLILAKNMVTAVLAGDRQNDSFMALSTWQPYLFVNPFDLICSSYVGYFEGREKMENMGFEKFGKISTQHSTKSIIMSKAIGKDSDPIHLLPSAYLTINSGSRVERLKEAHGIQQWWKQDLQIDHKLYRLG